MKCLRRFCITLLLLCVMITKGNVLAMNTGFSTKGLTDEEIESIISNVQIIKVIDEPKRKNIDCFDVNHKNLIAIGCGGSDTKTIGVYTNAGDFMYGYRFYCIGNFGVEWDNDDLIIYFARSDIALAVDPDGEVISVREIEESTSNNSYWNNHVYATERMVGDTKYLLRNNMGIFNLFASSYTQLTVTKIDEAEHTIYDVKDKQFLNLIVLLIVVLLFVGISLFAILKYRPKID